MGFSLEVEMIAEAHKLDLLTTPYVFNPDEAVAMARAGADIIVICHGGPIAMPADAKFILERVRGCHGFYGASSMERLPVEVAIKAQVEDFKALHTGGKA